MNETPFYIRTTEGACFSVATLDEALTQFASDKGYRLTLKAGEHEVVVRRNSEGVTNPLFEERYSAEVTIRTT